MEEAIKYILKAVRNGEKDTKKIVQKAATFYSLNSIQQSYLMNAFSDEQGFNH